MAGRHSLLENKNVKDSAALRGFAIAGTVGVLAGVGMPSAFATDGQNQAAANNALIKPSTVKIDTTKTAKKADSVQVSTSAAGEWKIAQVEFDARDAEVTPFAQQESEATEGTVAPDRSSRVGRSSDSVAPVAPIGSGSVSGSSVVSTGLAYQGSPYVWGGVTPAGWDCIGFVRYVYAQHGVAIGSVPSSVLSAGTRVPYSQVRPGDILYWPGHVAISLGNGQNVGAWNPGMGTRVGPDSWIGGTPVVIRVGA
ncbi:C40 family peptidase [Arcanobacterium canis]